MCNRRIRVHHAVSMLPCPSLHVPRLFDWPAQASPSPFLLIPSTYDPTSLTYREIDNRTYGFHGAA